VDLLIDKDTQLKISNLLKLKHFTIASAESCSGGLIANTFTNISGSSDYFDRGIVSYSNKSKMELLNVEEDILKEYGTVSEQVAKLMADGIREQSNVDIGISTTGIAGPTGGTLEKPIGLVYIAVSTSDKTIVKKFQFRGDRIQNKENTCNAAFKMLFEIVNKI
jgi:nicotinamide-nucleotide amidase